MTPADHYVLVGCEESQTITGAFRGAGFPAFSCDLLPTRGNPDWHFQEDIMTMLEVEWSWSLIILHPDCTALALSGNGHYGVGKEKFNQRLKAINWTTELWKRACTRSPHVALENPRSVIFQYLHAPTCTVQPYEHGHYEQKATIFALHNLPPLRPTKQVPWRETRLDNLPPSETRKQERSTTFPGLAEAIVEQWGFQVLLKRKP